jgi:Flp pilus assembly protein TadD
LVRQTQGRLTDALEHFRQAVTIDPKNVDARNHLAEVEQQIATRPPERR